MPTVFHRAHATPTSVIGLFTQTKQGTPDIRRADVFHWMSDTRTIVCCSVLRPRQRKPLQCCRIFLLC